MTIHFGGSKLLRLYNNSSFNDRYSLKVALYAVIFISVLTGTDVCNMENIWVIFSYLFTYNYIISFIAE